MRSRNHGPSTGGRVAECPDVGTCASTCNHLLAEWQRHCRRSIVPDGWTVLGASDRSGQQRGDDMRANDGGDRPGRGQWTDSPSPNRPGGLQRCCRQQHQYIKHTDRGDAHGVDLLLTWQRGWSFVAGPLALFRVRSAGTQRVNRAPGLGNQGLARPEGFEPPTHCFEGSCSIP
jgi:hypothetical protein